jgi:hypothetical protein
LRREGLPASPKLRKTEGQAEHLAVPKGSENIAREAARSAGFWFLVGIITYVGISLVIKIEATKTRLFLVVVVIGVAFGAASLLEHLLRRGEPADEGWPRWYSQFNNPTLYRSSDDAPYSYVVLPRPMVPDWLSKRGTRARLLSQIQQR